MESSWRGAIAGAGCASALENTAPEFWAACLAVRSGIAQIGGFDASKHFDYKQLIPLTRFAQLAIVAGSCYGGKTGEDAGFATL